MRYLLLSLCGISMLSCGSDYHFLKSGAGEGECTRKTGPPQMATTWYSASIDVAGKHFSGLVLIKNMPDSSQRVVFTNEAGVTFFDFGFGRQGSFTVHAILRKLNKRPVLRTLRKDFELLLGVPFSRHVFQRYQTSEEVFFGVPLKSETAYFITDKDCSSLHRLEWGSKRKIKVTIQTKGAGYPRPDTVEMTHATFPMNVRLTRIPKDAAAQ